MLHDVRARVIAVFHLLAHEKLDSVVLLLLRRRLDRLLVEEVRLLPRLRHRIPQLLVCGVALLLLRLRLVLPPLLLLCLDLIALAPLPLVSLTRILPRLLRRRRSVPARRCLLVGDDGGAEGVCGGGKAVRARLGVGLELRQHLVAEAPDGVVLLAHRTPQQALQDAVPLVDRDIVVVDAVQQEVEAGKGAVGHGRLDQARKAQPGLRGRAHPILKRYLESGGGLGGGGLGGGGLGGGGLGGGGLGGGAMRVATRLVDEKEAELVVLVDAEELSALRRSVPVWRPRLVPTQDAVGEGRPRQRRRVSAHADLREMRHEALVARRLERRVHQHQGLAVPRAERPPRPTQQDAELDKAVALQNHVHHVVPEHLLLLVSARARLHRVVEHRRDGAPLRKRRTLVRARTDAVWHAGVRVDEGRRHLCQKRSAKPRPPTAAPPGLRLQWHPTAKPLGSVCCFEHRQCRAACVLHALLHPVHWRRRLAGVHEARAALRRRGAFGVAHAAAAQQHVEEVAHCLRRRRLLRRSLGRRATSPTCPPRRRPRATRACTAGATCAQTARGRSHLDRASRRRARSGGCARPRATCSDPAVGFRGHRPRRRCSQTRRTRTPPPTAQPPPAEACARWDAAAAAASSTPCAVWKLGLGRT